MPRKLSKTFRVLECSRSRRTAEHTLERSMQRGKQGGQIAGLGKSLSQMGIVIIG